MADVLERIANWLPFIQLGLPIAFGVWALWRMRRPPIASRSDLGVAKGIAVAIGVFLGTVGSLVLAEIAGMFSGGPNYTTGFLWGGIAAFVVPLGCLAGWTVLASVRVKAFAWIGFLLGPFALIGGPLVLYGQLVNPVYG